MCSTDLGNRVYGFATATATAATDFPVRSRQHNVPTRTSEILSSPLPGGRVGMWFLLLLLQDLGLPCDVTSAGGRGICGQSYIMMNSNGRMVGRRTT